MGKPVFLLDLHRFIVLFVTVILAGCGYHLHSANRAELPGGIERIALSKVVNPSLETWIEPRIRTALSEQLQKRARSQVVDLPQAQGLLDVRVLTYSSGVKVENAQQETIKSVVSLTVQGRLIKAADQELLWQSSPISVQESFVNNGGQSPGLMAGYRAVDLAMERLVDQLYQSF